MLGSLVLSSAPVRAAGEADYEAGKKSYLSEDFVGAMPKLQKAADAGHTGAMVLLGRILNWGTEDARAADLYRKAAELGDPEGMVMYAVVLSAGEGVKKDPLAARNWALKAAEGGYADAINMVAVAYIKGDFGFSEADSSSPEALAWVERSAKQDYLPAVDALTLAYRTGGSLGVEKDPARAAEYEKQGNRLRDIDPSTVKKRKQRR
ncbi:MAG: sel1 repeat family protein [Betaproteobacteria bacterium]|nr:sel1 repeat family protein [Betaproteobacteria bacterium]